MGNPSCHWLCVRYNWGGEVELAKNPADHLDGSFCVHALARFVSQRMEQFQRGLRAGILRRSLFSEIAGLVVAAFNFDSLGCGSERFLLS